MDAAYRIRAARAEDVEAVVALERKTETLPHWPVAEYLSAVPVVGSKPMMLSTSRCLFIAEAGGAVAGFAVGKAMALKGAVSAELESVGVAERARRAGVGRALCEAVIAWSRRMGAAEIELEVRSRSEGPIALYEGLGFVAVGRRPRYYRDPVDDAILMRLDVAFYEGHKAAEGRDL